MAETPSSYKRFAQSDKISQGTTNAALSLNDYLPGQHVTGPNNNDIAATLAQVQAIPIGTATLSGNTYNVTISNYPNTATIYPGQKISVKFNADAPTADDTALNLSAFGQSLPLCARGVRMGQGAIKSGMILELVYRGDMWNADYDVVKANRNDNGYTTFADGQSVYSSSQVNNALAKYRKPSFFIFYNSLTVTITNQKLFCFEIKGQGINGSSWGSVTIHGYGEGGPSRYHYSSTGNFNVEINNKSFTITCPNSNSILCSFEELLNDGIIYNVSTS